MAMQGSTGGMTNPTETVYVRSPYLSPAQRSLKADQIGPSSHKNEYRGGVLMGNFVEDELAKKRKSATAALDSRTCYAGSFSHPQSAAANATRGIYTKASAVQRPRPEARQGLERALMFSHGSQLDQTSFLTMNELFYQDPNNTMALRTDQALKAQGVSHCAPGGFVERKRREWQDDKDTEFSVGSHYQTTKKQTIDATGDEVKAHPEDYLATATSPLNPNHQRKWGNSVKESGMTHKKLHLRNGVTYKRVR